VEKGAGKKRVTGSPTSKVFRIGGTTKGGEHWPSLHPRKKAGDSRGIRQRRAAPRKKTDRGFEQAEENGLQAEKCQKEAPEKGRGRKNKAAAKNTGGVFLGGTARETAGAWKKLGSRKGCRKKGGKTKGVGGGSKRHRKMGGG